MRTAAATLLELGRDERHLGAQLGLTAVLHTWSRDLSWHPHVHCVVTGGGLREDGAWKSTEPGFLLPVRVLGRLFRGKLLDALDRLHRGGQLRLPGSLGALRDRQSWSAWLGRLYAKAWVVYCKPPFDGVDSVYAYLGRYTHRIGLSNRRLLDVTDERVTFATRHGKHTSLPRSCSCDASSNTPCPTASSVSVTTDCSPRATSTLDSSAPASSLGPPPVGPAEQHRDIEDPHSRSAPNCSDVP